MAKKTSLRIVAAGFAALALSFAATSSAAYAAGKAPVVATPKWVTTPVTATGPTGQKLTVAQGNLIKTDTYVTISGRGYSKQHGIYVTYCVIPPKGTRPELCGPFDITGKNNASVWISSNPPGYAAWMVSGFGDGGTFKTQIKVTAMIGDQDCRVVKCALTTRADHTQPDYRKADVFVPVKIAN
ncbi:MAG: hypothetical protein CGW95_15960 [Phenylobacterium zucineum]|nr:MAG: hypothetical protein CGW95_15960 [Phenylobacterium zucineum]